MNYEEEDNIGNCGIVPIDIPTLEIAEEWRDEGDRWEYMLADLARVATFARDLEALVLNRMVRSIDVAQSIESDPTAFRKACEMASALVDHDVTGLLRDLQGERIKYQRRLDWVCETVAMGRSCLSARGAIALSIMRSMAPEILIAAPLEERDFQ